MWQIGPGCRPPEVGRFLTPCQGSLLCPLAHQHPPDMSSTTTRTKRATQGQPAPRLVPETGPPPVHTQPPQTPPPTPPQKLCRPTAQRTDSKHLVKSVRPIGAASLSRSHYIVRHRCTFMTAQAELRTAPRSQRPIRAAGQRPNAATLLVSTDSRPCRRQTHKNNTTNVRPCLRWLRRETSVASA